MTKYFLRFLSAGMLFLVVTYSFAQRTAVYENKISLYNKALDLFDKEKYAAAQKQFLLFLHQNPDPGYRINAEYYAGVCAMELFSGDAVSRLNRFIASYPENSKSVLAKYQLGRYYYRNKDNKKAVLWLDQVSTSYLSESEQTEFYFTYGYCLFKLERFDEAKTTLKNCKDEKTKYYDAANYYYGYVAYRQADYNEALEHFNRVKYHKTFGPLSVIYISQIYFSRGQYADVIKYCDTITNKEVATDVSGILGQSYYFLGRYDKAQPHLEKYLNEAPIAPGRSDVFKMANTYRVNKLYEKAAEQYLKLLDEKDSIAQYASYHLAECYQSLDKKANAKTAYEKVLSIGLVKSLNEEALFQAGKLSYELNATNSAITQLSSFVEGYPQSQHIDEAKSLISNLLLSTNKYDEAIRLLESIENRSEKDQAILQRIYYHQAEKLFLNNDYRKAADYFNKVLSKGQYNKKFAGLSYFWLAEIAYREGSYMNAISNFKKAQQIEEFYTTRFYNLTFYNLGYCYLKTEEFALAVEHFRKYTERDAQMVNPEVYTDAVIRTADSYFASRQYEKAIDYYNLVINKNLNGSDYSLYQKGLILGVLNKGKEKIYALQILIDKYPKSTFRDDAIYEKADMYLKLENNEEALKEFNNILSNYPNSIYLRKVMLNKGLVLFNMGKDSEAKSMLKELITKAPNSDEAREAVILAKNIYVGKGDIDEFDEWMKDVPNIVVSPSSQDSLTYQSAFNNYRNKDYEKASKGFGNYLSKFAGGYFTSKAYFYKAESDYQLKRYDDALTGYEYTANNIRSDFSERATRQAAVLNFTRKNYEKAFEYYAALERISGNKDNLSVALLGQMRCAGLLQKPDTAVSVSFRYINSGIASKEGLIEARLNTGRFFMSRNKPDSALPDFQFVLKESKNVNAAEAKYNIASIQFMRKEYKTSQKSIMELSDQFSGYEYWFAKAFILLADIHTVNKDYFQAKATLQSIIEEYAGEDLKSLAREKLKAVEEEENRRKSEQKKKIDERVNSRD